MKRSLDIFLFQKATNYLNFSKPAKIQGKKNCTKKLNVKVVHVCLFPMKEILVTLRKQISTPVALDIYNHERFKWCQCFEFRLKQQEIPAACIYKLWICFAYPEVGLKWTLMTPDPLVCFCCLARDQKSTQDKFPCCLYFEVCLPDFMIYSSEERFWNFQIQSEIMATNCSLFISITFSWPKGKPIVSLLHPLWNPWKDD